MRFLITVSIILTLAATAKAQTYLPGSYIDYNYRGSLLNNKNITDTASKKKWFVSKYNGVSTSFSFFKGGNATVVSAPIGLQLNRKLNNNLYAFAGVSLLPAYINFNSPSTNAGVEKINGINNGFNSKSLNLYSRAELGLQYINDERTFSISGSIGIERNNYSFPFQGMSNESSRNFTVINR